MINNLGKNKKWVGMILLAIIALNILFLPLTALAQAVAKDDSSFVGEVITWFTAKPLLFASNVISVILTALFGIILSIEAAIIDYILSPTTFSFTHATVVTLGWGITRDLANMFFILILLVMAFATVLKIQSYAIKQLWWKILLVALLVNFSLVIAGFIIDFAQILTTFFLKQALGNDFISLTTKLASSMKITNFFNPAAPTSALQGLGQGVQAAVAAVVGVILTLIGLVVTVFVFGATAIFLIVRILYIWFLLIVAPIAAMFWILPATSGYFKQWWSKFIQWTFFAPAYVFMIYLSLSIFTASGKMSDIFGNPPAGWNTATAGLTTASLPSAIFQWILVIAMMFGSLIVAKSFGVLPGKLINAVTGSTKGAAKSTALWGIKTYGRMATGARNLGAGSSSAIVRGVTAPVRFVGKTPGLQTLGALATGAKGGRLTAPLKSTPINPLAAVLKGAIDGSGLFKKKKQKFKLPSGETIELEPVDDKVKEEKPKEKK